MKSIFQTVVLKKIAPIAIFLFFATNCNAQCDTIPKGTNEITIFFDSSQINTIFKKVVFQLVDLNFEILNKEQDMYIQTDWSNARSFTYKLKLKVMFSESAGTVAVKFTGDLVNNKFIFPIQKEKAKYVVTSVTMCELFNNLILPLGGRYKFSQK